MDPDLLREVTLGSLARSTSDEKNTDDEGRYGLLIDEYPALKQFVTTVMSEVDTDSLDGHLGFDEEPIGYSEGLLHGVVTALHILCEYVEVSELREIVD